MVADVLHLEDQVAACDLVITGEGRLDAQTLEGKGPAGVAGLARKHGKPVIAFAGAVTRDLRLGEVFDETYAITPPGMPLDEAMQTASILLEKSAICAAPRFLVEVTSKSLHARENRLFKPASFPKS